MSYATLSDWSQRGTPHAFRTHATLAETSGSVQSHLDAASGIIDGYLASSYAVPLTNPPQFIKEIELKIAGWNYLISYGVPSGTPLELLQVEIDRAYDQLTRLNNGSLQLYSTSDATTDSEGRCRFRASSTGGNAGSVRNWTSDGLEFVK